DLIIGTQAPTLFENHDGHKQTPYQREHYVRMLAAGVNYFGPSDEHRAWIQGQPVFYRGTPSFPDSYYSANWIPHRMFIDEPMVRMGWAGGLPANCTGLKHMAENQLQRVASHYTLTHRLHPAGNGNEGGTL